jgi:hypothetical protein
MQQYRLVPPKGAYPTTFSSSTYYKDMPTILKVTPLVCPTR